MPVYHRKSFQLPLVFLILVLFNLFPCLSQPAANAGEIKSYWESSTPEAEGVSGPELDAIHDDIGKGKYGLIDHFLVIRNGKMIYDQSYQQDYVTLSKQYDTARHQYNYDHPDWHPFYNNTQLHSLQSVTKSITSLLLGIAMDEGLMIPLDSPVYGLFKEYEFDTSDERKRFMSLRDLLTMRSGIFWDESSSYADNPKNDCIVMELSEDWIQYVLDQPMVTTPGTQFTYNSGVSVLLGKIVRILTGKRIDEWAEEKLFGPLGITDYYWKITPKGEVDTEGGLYLSTYDLAKIGKLMLDKGMWEGKRIVSESWVEDSLQPRVKFNQMAAYGYQWWVPHYQGEEPKIFAGNGYGGQFLMVALDHDMIVVFNGWDIHGSPKKSSWMALQERILPNSQLTKTQDR